MKGLHRKKLLKSWVIALINFLELYPRNKPFALVPFVCYNDFVVGISGKLWYLDF